MFESFDTSSNSCYSDEFCDLIRWVMQTDPSERPSAPEVEQRIVQLLGNEE